MNVEALMEGAVFRPSEEETKRLQALADQRPLFIKAGFDPTRPDLHLGHAVLLRKLRQFQDAGHEVVLVIGDFTAMVGDPTGRSTSRPRLTLVEVERAAETYRDQAFKYLLPEKTYTVFNSSWYNRMTAADFIRLASMGTVAQMIERADFAQRFGDNKPIHLHEFLYPLLQGWDSVQIARDFNGRCDIELGGSDQLFNLLVGRALMGKEGLTPQAVMTMPLLEGTDARMQDGNVVGLKMSKGAGNYIALQDSPDDILHRIMLLDDHVTLRYIQLLSDLDFENIVASLKSRVVHWKGIKTAFARELIERLHSLEAAEAAIFKRQRVSDGGVPDDVLEVSFGNGERLARALRDAGIAKSISEGMRLIESGTVHLDGAVTRDKNQQLDAQPHLVRVGTKTKKFVRFIPV